VEYAPPVSTVTSPVVVMAELAVSGEDGCADQGDQGKADRQRLRRREIKPKEPPP
jgi:hypothetical protein